MFKFWQYMSSMSCSFPGHTKIYQSFFVDPNTVPVIQVFEQLKLETATETQVQISSLYIHSHLKY